MDLALILIGVLFIFTGIIGSFVPIIPGPISAWFGLLVLHQTSNIDSNFLFLTITFSIAVGVFILDYFIPMIGAKKFGGSNSGVIGATIGLIMGMVFLGPVGIFIGTFLGALIGELVYNPSDTRIAFKAATGTLIGFLTGVLLKFSVTLVFGVYFAKILLSSQL